MCPCFPSALLSPLLVVSLTTLRHPVKTLLKLSFFGGLTSPLEKLCCAIYQLGLPSIHLYLCPCETLWWTCFKHLKSCSHKSLYLLSLFLLPLRGVDLFKPWRSTFKATKCHVRDWLSVPPATQWLQAWRLMDQLWSSDSAGLAFFFPSPFPIFSFKPLFSQVFYAL